MSPPTHGESAEDGLSAEIIEIFSSVPGAKALKIWAPPDAGRPSWSATLNSDTQLFMGSVFKVFLLVESLRQAETDLDPQSAMSLGDQLDARLRDEETLDESVFCIGSPVFNPPNLTGKVTTRTVLEAMISHSDNTATDMMLLALDADQVRALIASLGLRQTEIPDSIRQFFAYVAGDPSWQTVSWSQLLYLATDDPFPHRPIVNDTSSSASSPDDLISFFVRALQGELFRFPETLSVFRAILATGTSIVRSRHLVSLPFSRAEAL